jgi:hypothetical protein
VTCYNGGTTVSLQKYIDLSWIPKCVWLWDNNTKNILLSLSELINGTISC